MPIAQRMSLLKKLEKLRNSKVIVIFMGTKPNMGTQLNFDMFRYVYDHLAAIKKCDNLDLFLYTGGGNTLVPHRLTLLIREYCSKFSVIVPFLAASAGTLLCLGANEIVMGKNGSLSPIDPTTSNEFNPINPRDKNKVIPISVEDVSSFLALAKDKALIRGEDKTLEVFKDLTGSREMAIHPLALGNVYRALRLIRDIAKKQLLLHVDNKEKIQRIVKPLTELLYSHQYLIDRQELKRMELNVVDSETVPHLDETIWNLYKMYEEEIKMLEPFNPHDIISRQPAPPQQAMIPPNLNVQMPQGANVQHIQQVINQIQNQLTPPPVSVPFSNYAAFIESTKLTHGYKFDGKITENRKPDGTKEISVEMKGYWERIR